MVKSSELAQAIASALEEDERTADAAISVVDEDGLVTLTGTVESQEVREAAEEITRSQEGVIDVVNDITLASEEDVEAEPAPPQPY